MQLRSLSQIGMGSEFIAVEGLDSGHVEINMNETASPTAVRVHSPKPFPEVQEHVSVPTPF